MESFFSTSEYFDAIGGLPISMDGFFLMFLLVIILILIFGGKGE